MNKILGLIFGFTATFLWASFYIVGRWIFGSSGDDGINPYLLNFLRFFLAFLALTPVMLKKENRHLLRVALRRDFLALALLSFVGIVMESYLISYSLNFTTASRSSMLANCSPIWTVLMAAWLLRDKITLGKTLGMLLGFTGIVLMICSKGGDIYANTSMTSLIGDAMALASGVCWAFFTVRGARLCNSYGGFTSTFIGFFWSWIIMLIPCFFTTSIADISAITPRFWLGIIYTGVFTLALANGLWIAALRFLPPGELGAFGYLSALLTFTLSLMVLKEQFSITFIFSIILILAGVSLMLRKQCAMKKK